MEQATCQPLPGTPNESVVTGLRVRWTGSPRPFCTWTGPRICRRRPNPFQRKPTRGRFQTRGTCERSAASPSLSPPRKESDVLKSSNTGELVRGTAGLLQKRGSSKRVSTFVSRKMGGAKRRVLSVSFFPLSSFPEFQGLRSESDARLQGSFPISSQSLTSVQSS